MVSEDGILALLLPLPAKQQATLCPSVRTMVFGRAGWLGEGSRPVLLILLRACLAPMLVFVP